MFSFSNGSQFKETSKCWKISLTPLIPQNCFGNLSRIGFLHSKQSLRNFSFNDITVHLDSSSPKPGELFLVCYSKWQVLNDIYWLVPVVAFTLETRGTIAYKGRELKIGMLKANRWGNSAQWERWHLQRSMGWDVRTEERRQEWMNA